MLRAVLFDLDGTLMDHDAARDAAIAAQLPDQPALADEWRRLEAVHYHEYAAGRISFVEQRRRRVRGIHSAMSLAEPADTACDAWFAAYLARYRAGWTAFEDVLPALAALADVLPGLRLGIVTNGEGEPQRAKLAAIGLSDCFPVFVASAEVGMRKPEPAIFLHACERLEVDPAAAAHVGDRLDLDAHGAASAGLRGVWLDRAGTGGAIDGVVRIGGLHELPAALAANGLPGATELGVPDAVLQLAGRDPRRAARRELKQLLSAWDTALLTALGGGGPHRFSALPRAEREQVLLSWCDSRLPQRRAAFHALRKASLLTYYGLPAPDGGPSPVWDAIGYPGPLGARADAPPKQLTPLAIGESTTLECDVCIVGSGAGGGVAAAVLSQAGLDVVVLERGAYYDDADFDGAELRALTTMYAGAPTATHDQSVGLIAGSCLGGGTVVNYTTSFRTPDDVRAEWAAHGVPAFASAEFTASLDAVCERLGVNQEHNDPSAREQKLRDACIALGWHFDAMPRNVNDRCDRRECGWCNFGCRHGAKQSTAKTWLVDAQAADARLVVGVAVERVLVAGGAARGVIATTDAGHRLTVRSRAVVAAAGALHTPALLKRSGLTNPNVGKHLRLHPATAVWGVYDEEVRPWEGVMQALYSDQHRNLHDGYGLKYETAAGHPHLAIPFMPWRGARAHHELMQAISHTVVFGILLRDRDAGEVRIDRDGEPVVRYKLSDYDTRHLRVGIEGAAQMHEAAGAQRVFSSQSRWVAYDPGRAGSGSAAGRARFMADADACGYGPGRVQLGSFHIMGSARMGGSPTTSACDPNAQTWDVRDLYVLDGSAFPTASGVNPQISIQAIAHMGARALAERLM